MSAAERITQPVTAPAELVQELENSRDLVLRGAQDLVVRTDDDYRQAGEILRAVRAQNRAIEERLNPIIAAANKAHKAATSLRSELTAPIVRAETAVKVSMAAFVDRRAEEERERRRQAEEVELKRQAEERARLEEARRDEARLLVTAAELEAKGQVEEAAALLDEIVAAPITPPPLPAPPPAPPIRVEKVAGASVRAAWSMRIVDERQLVEAWLRGEVPADVVSINQSALDRIARSMKAASRVPGCEAVSQTTIAGR
jgi:hypothetical protein